MTSQLGFIYDKKKKKTKQKQSDTAFPNQNIFVSNFPANFIEGGIKYFSKQAYPKKNTFTTINNKDKRAMHNTADLDLLSTADCILSDNIEKSSTSLFEGFSLLGMM